MPESPPHAPPQPAALLENARQASRYVRHLLDAEPALQAWLSATLAEPFYREEMLAFLQAQFVTSPAAAPAHALNEAALFRALRELRKRVMLRLIARDLGGRADLNEVMSSMSALAEVAISFALTQIETALCLRHGTPVGEESGKDSRAAQHLIVIAMGKLGGGELNVSSDIDLIFVYPEAGETEGDAGMHKLSNQEFFSRLGRKLIASLNDLSADGFVFRVDMRLRPYGDSGPLVMSFAMLEQYLITQGREWERYAYIKARILNVPSGVCRSGFSPTDTRCRAEARPTDFVPPGQCLEGTSEGSNVPPAMDKKCAAPQDYAADLSAMLQAFVFRKYLDFGALDALRDLHAQIRREVARREFGDNIKLGPGGIREIEFVAQVFQLIRGGRDAELRIRPTLQVLQHLSEKNHLSAQAASDLAAAYIFLRNLEHRLQYLDDQQTQMLPARSDDQAIIAQTMGFEDYAAFLQQLEAHRSKVTRHFDAVFAAKEHAAASDELAALWQDVGDVGRIIPPFVKGGQGGFRRQVDTDQIPLNPPFAKGEAAHLESAFLSLLGVMGFADADEVLRQLHAFKSGARYRQLPVASSQRVDTLVPALIAAAAKQTDPDATLQRLLRLLETISRRAAYLALLKEYPHALERLATLMNASPWAAAYLCQHPILLDALLDADTLYQPPDWPQLAADLDKQLVAHADDIERQMDELRHFHHAAVFQLLAQDLAGLLPLEILSDHLSALADLILEKVLRQAWANLSRKHRELPAFAIIGYGKLGGKELGYASDLDLIFLYDDGHGNAAEVYAKLAQRINTWLSGHTSAGLLYETDLRLRPNGASGLLVSSVTAFAQYQRQHAWVWEHQALTRARFVAGDAGIGAAFENIRKDELCQHRDLPKLWQEIVEMRQKMLAAHPNPHTETMFDIKHDRGGIIDVEFIVQFLVLGFAHRYPELTANLGNLALLNMAAARDLIPADLAEKVREAYREFRKTQHSLRLSSDAQQPSRIDNNQLQEERAAVLALWQQMTEDRGQKTDQSEPLRGF